jgi:hypothetical protein
LLVLAVAQKLLLVEEMVIHDQTLLNGDALNTWNVVDDLTKVEKVFIA